MGDLEVALARVSTIVRSMKEFAHRGQAEIAPVGLNHSISTTLTIARNEYKYVAELGNLLRRSAVGPLLRR
jgi:phosphoglycerate-specific signal transduction histidine kinase